MVIAELIGGIAASEAVFFQDPLLLGLSFLSLLPGSVVAYELALPSRIAAGWNLWVLSALAIGVNLLLCGVGAFLVARYLRTATIDLR